MNLLKKMLVFLCFFVASCNIVAPNSKNEEVWVCHNPESQVHGLECTEKTENLCLVRGDSTKFCWKMHLEDCNDPKIKKNVKFCEN